MAPTQKVDFATLVILDVGKNVAGNIGDKSQTFFEEAKSCALRIIERNIMIQANNMVGVILVGASKTKNSLAEQTPGTFKHIHTFIELQKPTWEMLSILPDTYTSHTGDWFEALIVAADHYKNGVSGIRIDSKKIVLITNFEGRAKIGSFFEGVVAGFQEENFEVYAIGPDLENIDNKYSECIQRFITETNGDAATFEEAKSGWMFHKKKAAKIVPQNFDLSIGPNLKIPTSIYIRVRDEPLLKSWQTAVKDPVTMTASTTEGVKKEKKFVNNENQTVLQKGDTIEGYLYGQQVIPFSDSDKEMLYQSGDRSFSVYGFTNADNIQWQNLHGDGTYYIFGRKGDKKAQYAIQCIIMCLRELNLVGIVRKVHSKNSEPKMYALFPVIDNNNIVCLSMVSICYKEEIKNMAFESTDLKKFSCTDEQVNAFKELIVSMDLTKAYDESYCDTEAFPIAETVSPAFQYVLDCIAFRAKNPDKPLPQPRDEITTLFKIPSLVEKRCREPIEKLKKLFPLRKVEPRKRNKKQNNDSDLDKVDEQNGDNNISLDLPTIDMKKYIAGSVTSIGTLNPVNDFNELLGKGKSILELSSETIKVIENLVYMAFNDNFGKAIDILKRFREESVNSVPEYYNMWLPKFKKDLLMRKKDNFLSIIKDNNLDFILKSENDKSTITEEDIMDSSQAYENDTIPDSVELSIRSEVNELFDDM